MGPEKTPMNTLYFEKKECRLCESSDLSEVLDLNSTPLKTPNMGDGTHISTNVDIKTIMVPLGLCLCRVCGNLQLSHVINPSVLYSDFRYETGISLGLSEHFVRLAEDIFTEYELSSGAKVIEIGSNDGTLLKAFAKLGCTVLGIDPAAQPARIANAAGIQTIVDFFSPSLADRLLLDVGKADLIIANNTLANIDKIAGFVDGVARLLKDDGLFVFETQYGPDVLSECLLDTIYHEHLSYFSATPLAQFFKSRKMKLIDAMPVGVKGGSFRCVVGLAAGDRSETSRINDYLSREVDATLGKEIPYIAFQKAIEDARIKLKIEIEHAKADGRRIVGYGASVGTMTLIQFFELTADIEAVIDDKPLTENLHADGFDIPVVGRDILETGSDFTVVVFAWRYIDAIIHNNAKALASGVVFINPLPVVSVIEDGQTGIDHAG
jgi:2-polyprenyl-3-methyl-5-hydroxy-6-metoxy-1,4-benzoquinol methylase